MEPLVAEDLLEEEVRQDALAHVPALQVREHAQDGVDLARVDELLERLDVDLALLHDDLLSDGGAVGEIAHRSFARIGCDS